MTSMEIPYMALMVVYIPDTETQYMTTTETLGPHTEIPPMALMVVHIHDTATQYTMTTEETLGPHTEIPPLALMVSRIHDTAILPITGNNKANFAEEHGCLHTGSEDSTLLPRRPFSIALNARKIYCLYRSSDYPIA